MTSRQPTEELTGTVAAVTWRSDDEQVVVARLTDGTTVRGQTAASPPLAAGAQYRFCGRWREHPTYGRQFEADAWFPVRPHGERGVLAYLEAFAEGVGPVRALRLWQQWGPEAVRVLEDRPQDVAAAGIMALRAAQIASDSLRGASAWQDTRIALMGLLSGRGFQIAQVMREAIRLWTVRAPDVIRRNPYALMLRRVPSCGFTRCDQLYKDLGLPCGRLKRQTLCLWHWLRTEAGGHTWVACDRAGNALRSLVGEGADPRRAMKLGKRVGIFRVRHEGDEHWIADARNADNERRLAENVKGLLAWTEPKKHSDSASRIFSAEMTSTGGV